MLLRDEITVDKEEGEGEGMSCQHRGQILKVGAAIGTLLFGSGWKSETIGRSLKIRLSPIDYSKIMPSLHVPCW